MGYYSSYFIFVVPALLIALFAQMNVSNAFRKYSNVRNSRGYTGYEIARRILDQNGLYDVQIQRVAGSLTDHFDPTAKVVRLSDAVYQSTSVAAIGVAAHEVGHAIQHQQGYFPIKIRSAIVPITNIGSTLAWPLAIFGIILGRDSLAMIGVWLFLIVVLFQLITLPVEFNASRRALATIREDGILEGQEYQGAKQMLTAAALTYVAALITAIANFLRLLFLVNRNRRN
ncbi:MAG: zinc metallopeptidase [Massiliimalia sp.]|jgi:Zn-dependent membrane protease YugP